MNRYVILLVSFSALNAFDYSLRLAMDTIFIIELERRNAYPYSGEYQNLTFHRNHRIAELPNDGLNNGTLSPQEYARTACDVWSSEIIQSHLLHEARYYIDSYRLFLSLQSNHSGINGNIAH